MSRPNLFNSIVRLIGADSVAGALPGSGWPGQVVVKLPSGRKIPVAVHVSTVGSHARKPYELRFQNPGSRAAVDNPSGSLPILLGLYLDEVGPILVGVDGRSRLGRETRFSILFKMNLIHEARAKNWSVYTSSTGENIYAFHPSLFPVLVEMIAAGLDLTTEKETSDELGRLTIAAGLLEDDTPEARKRARRAADVLIRNRAFGRGVVLSYGGFCAMCGIDYGLVAGAHIYPASAPESPDKIWNGLALCHNHHAAFDRHKIWVDPMNKAIKMHPDLIGQAADNAALQAFLGSTFEVLMPPNIRRANPKKEMFDKRYDYYEGFYDWVA